MGRLFPKRVDVLIQKKKKEGQEGRSAAFEQDILDFHKFRRTKVEVELLKVKSYSVVIKVWH